RVVPRGLADDAEAGPVRGVAQGRCVRRARGARGAWGSSDARARVGALPAGCDSGGRRPPAAGAPRACVCRTRRRDRPRRADGVVHVEPLTVADFETLARARLDDNAWEYVRGGAGDE